VRIGMIGSPLVPVFGGAFICDRSALIIGRKRFRRTRRKATIRPSAKLLR
jgi:hypothetical protein